MRRGRFFRVYSANHPFEAHFVRTVLESHGIWAIVQNENLAPYGVGAEVWVEGEQTDDALRVVEEYRRDDSGQLSIVEDDARGRLAPSDHPIDGNERCVRCGAAVAAGAPCPECDDGMPGP